MNEILKNLSWKAFLISFIGVFAMVALPYLGFKPTVKTSTLASPKLQPADPMNNIQPKLEQKPATNFKIKTEKSLIPTAVAAADYQQANSYAVVDLDTGQVIAEKNLDRAFPIASITKLMSAVVALDLSRPNDRFKVSPTAADIIPTKIGVVPGQELTLEELLYAMLLTSANDATEVVKENIDQFFGSPVFIKAMNAKAQFLGLEKSSFTNAQGFDNPRHYSSVHDLTILAQYALTNYPLINEIIKKDYYFLPKDEHHKQYDLYNWNGLIGVYPGASGIKIGNTENAQKTTMVLAERGGKKLLVTVLGAPDIYQRDLWAAQLLDLGYQSTLNLPPINVTKEQLQAKYATWKTFD